VLTPAQRKWFLLEQIVLPTLFNLAFNAGLGWATFRAFTPVPLWAEPRIWTDLLKPTIGGDVLGMLFFLPGLTCLIGTPLIKRAARLGKVERLRIAPEQHWLLRHMPRSLWVRSAVIGLACVIALGPVSLGVLSLLGLTTWPLGAAVWFKGVYAGLLAGVVTPPIALYALSLHDRAHVPA
jgi:hypothetical protein